jgi:hypothetical protein
MDKERVSKHLEERKQQLYALISHLKTQDKKHPLYSQLSSLEAEYEIVIDQLQRLQK